MVMTKKGFFPSLLSLCLLLLTAGPARAQTASYTLEQSVADPQVNEIFYVKVLVNSSVEINTVHLEIGYPPQSLKIQDLSLTNSEFPNVIERSIDEAGLIKLTAFTVSPYSGQEGLVATLKFRSLVSGGGSIDILADSKIHQADGLGTDIFSFKTTQSNLTSLAITETFAPTETTLSGETTESKTETLFPEKGVTDYTQDTKTKLQKVTNQVKATAPVQQVQKATTNLPVLIASTVVVLVLILIGLYLVSKKKQLQS